MFKEFFHFSCFTFDCAWDIVSSLKISTGFAVPRWWIKTSSLLYSGASFCCLIEKCNPGKGAWMIQDFQFDGICQVFAKFRVEVCLSEEYIRSCQWGVALLYKCYICEGCMCAVMWGLQQVSKHLTCSCHYTCVYVCVTGTAPHISKAWTAQAPKLSVTTWLHVTASAISKPTRI